MHRILLLAVAMTAFLLTSPLRAELIDIDNTKLQELISEGVTVIDVRRAEEWQETGVIEGSRLQTFFDKSGRYDAKQWLDELDAAIDTSEPLILICQSGVRSSIIGKWLGKQLDAVYNVEAGIVKWIADKHPVVAMNP